MTKEQNQNQFKIISSGDYIVQHIKIIFCLYFICWVILSTTL